MHVHEHEHACVYPVTHSVDRVKSFSLVSLFLPVHHEEQVETLLNKLVPLEIEDNTYTL